MKDFNCLDRLVRENNVDPDQTAPEWSTLFPGSSGSLGCFTRALSKREYLVIIWDNFC